MPSTTSSSVSRLFASSTVMTPSLPTFFMASASMRPISTSPFAEIVPTWAISSLLATFFERFCTSATTASTARSMPRRKSIGFIPAATALMPSRTMACARTVAVVVPSPAIVLVLLATSLTICEPMFSNLSESSISFATVTPSLVMRGAPYDLSSTTLRPFGPNVTRTASARISMPRSIRSRASLLSRMSFAAIIVFPSSWRLVGDDAHDVGFLHDDEVLTIDLDLVAGPFPEQHPVAGLDVGRLDFAILAAQAGTDSDDIALHRFFLGIVWDDDPTPGLFFAFDAPDQHTVMQRTEIHRYSFAQTSSWRRSSHNTGAVPQNVIGAAAISLGVPSFRAELAFNNRQLPGEFHAGYCL